MGTNGETVLWFMVHGTSRAQTTDHQQYLATSRVREFYEAIDPPNPDVLETLLAISPFPGGTLQGHN